MLISQRIFKLVLWNWYGRIVSTCSKDPLNIEVKTSIQLYDKKSKPKCQNSKKCIFPMCNPKRTVATNKIQDSWVKYSINLSNSQNSQYCEYYYLQSKAQQVLFSYGFFLLQLNLFLPVYRQILSDAIFQRVFMLNIPNLAGIIFVASIRALLLF